MASSLTGISPERVTALRDRELDRFSELRPRGMALLRSARDRMPNGVPMSWMTTLYQHPPIVVARGAGGSFTDVDGNDCLDFNLADMSMFAGYGGEAVERAVGERVAAGAQFLLPGEDDVEVAALLGDRFGPPRWQFTLSATTANTEAIRVARAVTGRSAVVMFDGKYHGHADELLGELHDGEVRPAGLGVPPDATRHVRLVPFNDLEAVERELAAARATLTDVLRPDAYAHAAALGARLADGIDAIAAAHGLDWRAHRLFNRSGYTHAPQLPSDAREARASFDAGLFNVQRLYMVNRGVWEAIDSAGPACGVRAGEADVDRYLEVLDEFLAELTAS